MEATRGMSAVLPIPGSKVDELRRIAERHGIDRLREFGSCARGEAGPESDVDLLIRLQPGRGFSDLMAFCHEAEAALGRRVDVVTEDGLSPYIRDRVLAEAIPL
jgi:predicted nucleotidyltransferase